MNIYVFNYVDKLTYRYHEGGGLVVIAKDREHVERLTKEATTNSANILLKDEEWEEVIIYPTEEDAEPRVFVFPDAGCC